MIQNTQGVNVDRWPFYEAYKNAGLGWKIIEQNAQHAWFMKFMRWEYGDSQVNNIMYGSLTAPTYDLSVIRVPTAVFYTPGMHEGDYDAWLSNSGISGFTQIVYQNKLQMAAEAIYMGLDMKWFDEVDVLIRKYGYFENVNSFNNFKVNINSD
jgi:hypothetical protein